MNSLVQPVDVREAIVKAERLYHSGAKHTATSTFLHLMMPGIAEPINFELERRRLNQAADHHSFERYVQELERFAKAHIKP